MNRKSPLVVALFVVIAVGMAVAFALVRWPKAELRKTPGIGVYALGKFRAREITATEAKSFMGGSGGTVKDIQPDEKGKVHYFAEGYSLSDPASPNGEANWVCMFNPTKRSARLEFTFYYEDHEPTRLEYEVPAETSRSIGLHECKEVLQNKRFGAKIASSEAMVLQVCTAYYGAADKADGYTRAMHSVICSNTTAQVQHYADGFVIDKPGMRLKEPEWAFLLNPNPEPARVVLNAYYGAGEKKYYALEIPPQRLCPLRLDDVVIKNKLFGAKFVSSVPIAVQQTRWVEEEDRQTIRAAYSVMARPGELEGEKAEVSEHQK